ncbi:DUF4232 domain-containing protein [Micromonospora sp. NBC_01813]|uniref:DUF4232 domain-containing protein n=1 Tax=Micromonospora sp. NBC_01813 TaxID=2975988 RepID=UPI002DDC19AD|nr:DUF4232 domain-containing protein [Micromonospora sp. NBC_01813]WSA09501.1 DUF4232 domain-containing protein [Micromonospora sp. NBC_01813]
MRVTRTVVATCLIPAALVLAACGDAAPEESPASPPPTASADPSDAGTDTPGEGGVGACASADLTVDVTIQDAGLALLALTNDSTATCQLDGWVTLAFERADRSPVDVAQQQVEQPGPPVATELDPGESAFAGVKWATCDPASADCAVATTVRVGAPGDSATVVARVIGTDGADLVGELPVADVQIGSIQPSTQGVVAW